MTEAAKVSMAEVQDGNILPNLIASVWIFDLHGQLNNRVTLISPHASIFDG